ncbi:MAG TPA: hypothetical protein VE970_00975, partial [Pseudolabrys sp.]|nr:hypothetical protein [Pseudolabrys sp.]
VKSGEHDRDRPASDVSFTPKADITAGLSESALCAKRDLMHRSNKQPADEQINATARTPSHGF